MRVSRVRTNERGIISIFVTMSMMIVVSLVVVGFAQVARREQRLSQDNQLSSQAYYAAESGINRTAKLIEQSLATGNVIQPDTSCDEVDNVLSVEDDIKFTCVTVEPSPDTIRGTLSSESSKTFKLKTSSTLSGFKVSWQVSDDSKSRSGCPAASGEQFTNNQSWNCPFGVLRYDLTRVPTGTFTSTVLQQNTRSGFISPTSVNGGTTSIDLANGSNTFTTGNRAFVSCSDSECSATFNNLQAGKEYYLNLRLMYGSSAPVEIASTTSGQQFVDSQVQIDATGKAQDVLRRVRVYKSLINDSNGLDAAMIVGDGPCKQQFLSLVKVPNGSGGEDEVPTYDQGSCFE
jgi:Tfp pilus assembly protein PilX